MDPAQMSYIQDIRIAFALWEGLTTLDPRTLEPTEGVAYYPPQISEDGKTYRFTLRPDARWSNGDPVTARDFVRGWRRAIEPGTADVYAELISRYVDEAESYVHWRMEHVAVLGLVRQLQNGSPIRIDAVRDALREDRDDLAAFEERASESTLSFEQMLKRLNLDGKV